MGSSESATKVDLTLNEFVQVCLSEDKVREVIKKEFRRRILLPVEGEEKEFTVRDLYEKVLGLSPYDMALVWARTGMEETGLTSSADHGNNHFGLAIGPLRIDYTLEKILVRYEVPIPADTRITRLVGPMNPWPEDKKEIVEKECEHMHALEMDRKGVKEKPFIYKRDLNDVFVPLHVFHFPSTWIVSNEDENKEVIEIKDQLKTLFLLVDSGDETIRSQISNSKTSEVIDIVTTLLANAYIEANQQKFRSLKEHLVTSITLSFTTMNCTCQFFTRSLLQLLIKKSGDLLKGADDIFSPKKDLLLAKFLNAFLRVHDADETLESNVYDNLQSEETDSIENEPKRKRAKFSLSPTSEYNPRIHRKFPSDPKTHWEAGSIDSVSSLMTYCSDHNLDEESCRYYEMLALHLWMRENLLIHFRYPRHIGDETLKLEEYRLLNGIFYRNSRRQGTRCEYCS